MIANTPHRPPSAAEYLLAAEYWHPDVSYEAALALLRAIKNVPVDDKLVAALGVPDEDQQDALCWYYLLRASEAAS